MCKIIDYADKYIKLCNCADHLDRRGMKQLRKLNEWAVREQQLVEEAAAIYGQ